MRDVDVEAPGTIIDSLPADGEDVSRDMQLVDEGWEHRINDLLAEADDAGSVVDVIERFEDRWQRYDDFIVELRGWGRSPIYAMAWRDLHESLIQKLYAHDTPAEVIDRNDTPDSSRTASAIGDELVLTPVIISGGPGGSVWAHHEKISTKGATRDNCSAMTSMKKTSDGCWTVG